MYLRAVGRRFTQTNAYFLVMNSKRCNAILEYGYVSTEVRSQTVMPQNKTRILLTAGSSNRTSKKARWESFYLWYWCKWHCQRYWRRNRSKFPHVNWTFTVYLLVLQLLLLFRFKKILKFCFEHSDVSQKRNKRPVPNKRPVSNTSPPSRYQKSNKRPGR